MEIELLKIDYLRFNLKSYLNDIEISNLAVYFRRLGFSSYKKQRDNIKERTVIFNDKYFIILRGNTFLPSVKHPLLFAVIDFRLRSLNLQIQVRHQRLPERNKSH